MLDCLRYSRNGGGGRAESRKFGRVTCVSRLLRDPVRQIVSVYWNALETWEIAWNGNVARAVLPIRKHSV